MSRVALTGAAGGVGREMLNAFDDDEVTPLTHREREGIDSLVCDVEDLDRMREVLADHETVIHLAGNPSPEASWESVLHTNVDGTRNVYRAAVDEGLDRVVFASTNHVQQMYNIDDPSRPETMRAAPRATRPDDPPKPDSYYAVSKVSGEALGSYYAERHGLEVVNLRIGWLLTPDELAEIDEEREENVARYARAMWLSPRDCRQAARRSVEADLPENPLTVNLLSENAERYLSLTETMRGLGYEPRDDSARELD